MHKVLIVDDEKDICFLISEILKDEKYITETLVKHKNSKMCKIITREDIIKT